jgi:hypothetical protein
MSLIVSISFPSNYRAHYQVSGHKKRPPEEPRLAHGWLSPDGYTVLPMRLPTTRMFANLIMDDVLIAFAGLVNRIHRFVFTGSKGGRHFGAVIATAHAETVFVSKRGACL